MRIYDITLPISPKVTPIYAGDPSIEIDSWNALSRGDAANVSLLHLSAHTGTHLDAPAHFFDGAPAIWTIPLDSLVGRATVFEMPPDINAIDANDLSGLQLEQVERVLFKTRNSDFWNNPQALFREDYTYISVAAAQLLVERGVKLVGLDYLSVDQFNSTDYSTHKLLLSSGVLILEGLDLREVSPGEYELICLPLKIEAGSGDGSPVRAILTRSRMEKD